MVETAWPFGELERKSFGCVVADPPWFFRSRVANANPQSDRDVTRHYPVMDKRAIMALPVKELAHPDGCHLFMWATGPCLPQALETISAWGFKYSGMAFTWIKLRRSHDPMQLRILPTAESDLFVGLGFTTRKNAEFCLLARRGNAKRDSKSVREVILSPVREHSRKPEEFRNRVDRYIGPGIPVVELFARSTRPGWSAWGNETEKFDAGSQR